MLLRILQLIHRLWKYDFDLSPVAFSCIFKMSGASVCFSEDSPYSYLMLRKSLNRALVNFKTEVQLEVEDFYKNRIKAGALLFFTLIIPFFFDQTIDTGAILISVVIYRGILCAIIACLFVFDNLEKYRKNVRIRTFIWVCFILGFLTTTIFPLFLFKDFSYALLFCVFESMLCAIIIFERLVKIAWILCAIILLILIKYLIEYTLIVVPHYKAICCLIMVMLFFVLNKTIFSDQSTVLSKGYFSKMRTIANYIAHELRTPLSSTFLFTKAISKIIDNSDGKYNNELLQVNNKILKLVLFSLASIEASLLDVKVYSKNMFETFDIRDVVSDVVEKFAIFNSTEIDVIVDIEDFKICGVLPLLSNVVLNLCKNAKNSIDNNARRKIMLISTQRGKLFNFISVTDFGKGISDELLPYIFSNLILEKDDDVGTGLKISTNAIRQLNGEIICITKQGDYTKFTIALPAVKE